MIKGTLRTFDFRFGDEFVNFLELAGKAAATVEVYHVNDENESVETEVVRFNYQDSVTKYKRRLLDTMYEATESLKGLLDGIYDKIEKLNFLAHFIVEIESCRKLLIRDEKGVYTHKGFSLKYLSGSVGHSTVTKSEESFQEHYYWTEHYLEKMQSFLGLLKEAIEVTPQSDIRLPEFMKKDVNASSQDLPFEFFDYLFFRNGIYWLRLANIPTEEDHYYYDVSWDPKKETLTYHEQNPDTGEWEESVTYFKDILSQKIHEEFLKSKALIDAKISMCKNKEEAEFYVQKCLGHLKYFLLKVPLHRDAKKYDFLENFAPGVIKYLFERYSSFFGKGDELIDAALKGKNRESLQQGMAPKSLPSANMQLFKVAGMAVESFATIIYKYLHGVCISYDTSLEAVANAFSSKSYETPLKIKWIAIARNGNTNKKALIYLFDELARAGLIEEETTNAIFIKRLQFIFADAHGQPLKNLPVSNSGSGTQRKTMDQYLEAINNAIKALSQLTKGSIPIA